MLRHFIAKVYNAHYQSEQIWNCDESSVQAKKNVDVWVLLRRCYKFMYLTTLHKREWLSMLFQQNKIITSKFLHL